MRSLCTILMIFDVHLQCWILLGALRKFSTLRLVLYLESSSNRKELLKALLESSVIKTLILAITWKRNLALIDLKHIFTWRPRTAWNNSIFKKEPSIYENFWLTSGATLCVPYLSSQYMVLIRYSCCILKTWKQPK